MTNGFFCVRRLLIACLCFQLAHASKCFGFSNVLSLNLLFANGIMSKRGVQVTSIYFTRNRKTNIPLELNVDNKDKPNKAVKPVKTKKAKIEVNFDDDNRPSNWRLLYDNIVKMRSETVAAVDTMGCEKCFDTEISDKTRRFQILVSLMLSSQTRDEITFATMTELKKNGLSVDFIDNISIEDLQKLIKSVGFFRRKAEYLKKTAQILKRDYSGDIPRTLEDLIKLPGVGPKMAHLAMKVAWNEITGIAIDTHMHRICNRLKWVNTKTPEQTRVELESWLPREHWDNINHLLVGFGQSICSPIKPNCKSCLNKSICPSSNYTF